MNRGEADQPRGWSSVFLAGGDEEREARTQWRVDDEDGSVQTRCSGAIRGLVVNKVADWA